MDKIVSRPLKVDFHIHSKFSSFKDGTVVSNGNKENLPVLMSKLEFNKVDLFAITDHDNFSFDLYSEAVKLVEKSKIFKNFPGVEFSVGFDDADGKNKILHIVTLFDDCDIEKIKNIETVIAEKRTNCFNVTKDYFLEEEYFDILKKIGLDVVLIVHQKDDFDKGKTDRDFNNLTRERMDELVALEFFDAFEYKNVKKGIFNSIKLKERYQDMQKIKVIAGSDCHEWSAYPKISSISTEDPNFEFAYLRCLPTFRGLTMAFTDFSRIRKNDSFYLKKEENLNEIVLNIDGVDIPVPLSDGINAIIGDNSVGKSLLIHALSNYEYLGSKRDLKTKYIEFNEKHHLIIPYVLRKENVREFDFQGHIRQRFSDDTTANAEFIKEHYPKEFPDKEDAKKYIIDHLSPFYDAIEASLLNNKLHNNFIDLEICEADSANKYLSVSPRIANNDKETDIYLKTVGKLDKTISYLKELLTVSLEEDEVKYINETIEQFNKMREKYKKLSDRIILNNSILSACKLGCESYATDMNKYLSNKQQKYNEFLDNSQKVGENIAKIISNKVNIKDVSIDCEPYSKTFVPNNYGNYTFINCFEGFGNTITKTDINDIIKSQLKEGKTIKTDSVNRDFLEDSLLSYVKEDSKDPLDVLKTRIESEIDKRLQPIQKIIKDENDITQRFSQGMNSTIYFDILSKEDSRGIYVVDQPEDDVSQKKINENILPYFRDMAQKRQIILVTHNPQFIINLDVDNVIYLSIDNDDKFHVQSGALEYVDKESKTDILQIVADNLDGGVESIKRRWKRYDKNI